MYTLSRTLWQDEAGFIVSAELVMLGTVLVVGLITGIACVQDAVIGEYTEVAGALRGLDQSYSVSGMHGCWDRCCGLTSWTAGSAYYQQDAEREVCFGLCPPGPIVCPSVETPAVPLTPVPETPALSPDAVPTPDAVVPAPCPCEPVPPPACIPDGVIVPAPWVNMPPALPFSDEPAVPRPCPCSLQDCPPEDEGACPQPTVVPLPGPSVW